MQWGRTSYLGLEIWMQQDVSVGVDGKVVSVWTNLEINRGGGHLIVCPERKHMVPVNTV